MKTSKKNLGNLGEDIACRFLLERGQTVLERNWRSGHQEIDIITIDTNGVHFVEVKSRTAPYQSEPQEAIDGKKARNMTRAANSYIRRKYVPAAGELPEVFFDAVAVVFDGGEVKVEYFPQIFIPLYV